MINKNDATVNFANHFATKSSIKNLLKKVPNAQKISVLFEDEKYGKELLGYGNMREKLDIVLADVFESYTSQVTEWRKTGDNRNISDRVSLFKNLLADRIEKKDSKEGISTGQQIVDNLADFLKTITGKEIESILTDAGVSNDGKDTLRMDIITWVVVRAFINKEMLPCEKVEGEIIEPTNASHKSVSQKGDEVVPDATSIIHVGEFMNSDDTRNMFVNDLKKLLDSENDNSRVIAIIKPQLPVIADKFVKYVNELQVDESLLSDVKVRMVLGDDCTLDMLRGIKCINALKLLTLCTTGVDINNGDDIIISSIIFHTIIDVINNIGDDKVISDGLELVRLLVGEKTNNYISSLFHHVRRIDDMVKRNFVTKVFEPKQQEEIHRVAPQVVDNCASPEKKKDPLDFIFETLGNVPLAAGHGRLHPTCR